MNDDLEPRLRNAFHHSSLPTAPASLVEALERVPNVPVTARRRASGRGVWAPLAVAAVLVVAAAVVIGGGQRGIAPGPTAAVSLQPSVPASPEPSAAASAPPTGTLRLVYRAEPVNGVQPIAGDVEVIIDVVAHRLASADIVGATFQGQGDDRLIVELPRAVDTYAARRLIGQLGHIDFVPLGTNEMQVGDPIDPAKFPALFTGDQIDSAAVGTDQVGGRTVSFILKSRGAKLFGDYTAANIGTYFAIVLDGTVVTAPVINDAIPGGHVDISSGGIGGSSLEEAQQLVAVMDSGQLPYPIVEISNEIVPAPSFSVP
jgi:SecD/SecF fusion protein